MRSGIDIDRQDSGAAIGGGRELVIGVRLVITALSQIRNQALEGAIDIGFPVLVALRQTDPRRQRRQRIGRIAVHLDRADAEPHARLHVDHERVAILPFEPGSRRQRRIAIALFMEDEGEELNQLGHA